MSAQTLSLYNNNIKNRYFNLNVTATEYHKVLSKFKHAKFAVFTDLIENSMLDIIVVNDHTNMDNIKNDIAPIAAVYNNLNSVQYFVKARMLTDEKIGAPVR